MTAELQQKVTMGTQNRSCKMRGKGKPKNMKVNPKWLVRGTPINTTVCSAILNGN